MKQPILLAVFWMPIIIARLNAQEISEQATNFAFGLKPDERAREAALLSPSDKERLVGEMQDAAKTNPAAKHGYTVAMATLGDEESIKQLVSEFIGNDGASPGLLAPMQNPRIIEMVAPEFFRDEPMRLTGGDVVIVPRSFRAAELAVEILANSPAFNSDVINWARTVRGLSWSEKRELVRPWWKANEQVFREKNYKAAQPGPEPPRDPFATEHPEAPQEAAMPAQSRATPTPVRPVPAVAVTESPTPSAAFLWTGAVAAIALLVSLVVFWKRRA